MKTTIEVSLSADGHLELNFPGDRAVELRNSGTAIETIRKVLIAQAEQELSLGLDGSPTTQQVRHWERHEIFANPHCPFCLAEGRRPREGESRRCLGEGVEVRTIKKIPTGARGLRPALPREVLIPITCKASLGF